MANRQWASLELEGEPEDAELSPIYDFNTRRDHWKEWREYSRGRNARALLQIIVWSVLLFLTVLFCALYISERHRSTEPSQNVDEFSQNGNEANSGEQHLFYSNSGYMPFAGYELNEDYRGVQREQFSSEGMVATDHGDCSNMAADILKQGGNAMDAAVTAALCIGIRNPFASGTGGGTFILVRLSNGTASVIDAREVAPKRSTKNMFRNRGTLEATVGGLAIAVPLELKGLEMMWKTYGVSPWKQLIDPVIPLARDGFPAHPQLITMISGEYRRSNANLVFDEIREAFLIPDNGIWRLPNVGEMCCRRPALASTLDRIAETSVEEVYSSDWGDDLVEDISKFSLPGIIEKEDLITAQPVMKDPITSRVFGMDVFTVPPPSSGATLVMAMKFMESYDDHTEPDLNAHRLIEAMKHMFAVRSHFGDPGIDNEFLNLDKMLKIILRNNFIQELRNGTSDSETQDISFYGGRYKLDSEALMDAGTSHICVADAEGNTVSMTTSINGAFGSYMISPKTGLLLNNHMSDFSKPGIIGTSGMSSPPASSNFIRPGRKPLSSMSPLIFVKDGEMHMALGASGGPLIITALLQVAYNHLNNGVDLETAIISPRISDLLSGITMYERYQKGPVHFAVDENLVEYLKRKGHGTFPINSHSELPNHYFANVIGIEVPKPGVFRGVVDPRKDGAAASNL